MLVEAIKPKGGRVNIPTHELRDFVKGDEQKPMSATVARSAAIVSPTPALPSPNRPPRMVRLRPPEQAGARPGA
jgi:hypothetical protein